MASKLLDNLKTKILILKIFQKIIKVCKIRINDILKNISARGYMKFFLLLPILENLNTTSPQNLHDMNSCFFSYKEGQCFTDADLESAGIVYINVIDQQ